MEKENRKPPLKPVQVCFSGGGTLAPLHVGAVLALEEAGYSVVDPSGASAGAIISACIALETLNELITKELVVFLPAVELYRLAP